MLTSFGAKGGNIFKLIDKTTRAISDKELSEIKMKVRAHALAH